MPAGLKCEYFQKYKRFGVDKPERLYYSLSVLTYLIHFKNTIHLWRLRLPEKSKTEKRNIENSGKGR